ncbi:S1C family serine protease [Cognatishimia sp. F0-27]|uniref:S1C family serine protease n=1 Tax=Cognatishimia sp. F0-27 TaxID=2816855 RepID=UPI001D0C2E4F|nr:serine protease [Cognatishimia sp. F0-27]MCC1494059.1 trypsin-like peptidase domain-containing protein [Cognatishimia sp. F0-27]
MKAISLLFCLILTVVSAFPRTGTAQDYAALFSDFDVRSLTYNERRYLQAALAFEGHYFGLLDGDWGRLSRRAMEDYSRSEFNAPSEEWHAAILALSFLERYEKDGWDMFHFDGLGMSVMLPLKTILVDPPSDELLNYRHQNSSLSVSVGRHTTQVASSFHEYTFGVHALASKPYSVRKENFAVTSATMADGSGLYTRSNFIGGLWSTIMVHADRADRKVFSAVTSSIAVGESPSLDISLDGHLLETLTKTIALAAGDDADSESKSEKEPSRMPAVSSSGSGFFVSQDGHVLTNAHVVDVCRTVLVDGMSAKIVDASQEFDLALLKTELPDDKAVAVFSASPARLNSDVTVAGYPYSQILGGLNITRGAVSSLRGLLGDAKTLQITAPVQSGNSGGPLLGADGEVLGVVVSKLDALAVASNGGDLPQNINFAITGEIAKLFLAQNNVSPALSLDDVPLAPEDLAQTAAKFTSLIECRN